MRTRMNAPATGLTTEKTRKSHGSVQFESISQPSHAATLKVRQNVFTDAVMSASPLAWRASLGTSTSNGRDQEQNGHEDEDVELRLHIEDPQLSAERGRAEGELSERVEAERRGHERPDDRDDGAPSRDAEQPAHGEVESARKEDRRLHEGREVP